MDVLLLWLESGWVAETLRRSMPAYVVVNGLHILGIGVLLGAILLVDLRLMGGLSRLPASVASLILIPAAGPGLALALATGFALFTVQAREYLVNPAFIPKLAVIAVGILNVALTHRGPAGRWLAHAEGPPPWSARLAGGASLACWIAALFLGRLIGFL